MMPPLPRYAERTKRFPASQPPCAPERLQYTNKPLAMRALAVAAAPTAATLVLQPQGYNRIMAPVVHISEADAARDFAALTERVRAGVEVIIESDAQAVAVLRPAEPG